MTRPVPLHRVGVYILIADLAFQLRTTEDRDAGNNIRYRLRLLYAAGTMTDAELEAYFEGLNRADAPANRRIAHCWVLDVLEHTLESPAFPDLGGDDVAA